LVEGKARGEAPSKPVGCKNRKGIAENVKNPQQTSINVFRRKKTKRTNWRTKKGRQVTTEGKALNVGKRGQKKKKGKVPTARGVDVN